MPPAPGQHDPAAIDAWLPQTQCTRCGYPDCAAYARAVAEGAADINRCPPGGEATIQGLSRLLSIPARPLDPEVGEQRPRRVARIVEDLCIGCRLCLQACPVDAIIGASKFMHTVIAAECTGCELCVPPCPVDCIVLEPLVESRPTDAERRWPDYAPDEVARARTRAAARRARLARRDAALRLRDRHRLSRSAGGKREIKREIAAALARARARRHSADH